MKNPGYIIKQCEQEIESWKRALAFVMEENIALKYRMGEILKNESGTEAIDTFEYFQNSFLKEDEMISLIRMDIYQQENLLVKEQYFDGVKVKDLLHVQNRLRNEIEKLEAYFNQLKNAFNYFATEA